MVVRIWNRSNREEQFSLTHSYSLRMAKGYFRNLYEMRDSTSERSVLSYNVAQEHTMSANAVVRARIDEKTKKKATVILKSMGLTPSSAFRLLMTKVVAEKTLPFELRTPNSETIEAMKAGLRGDVTTVGSVEELFRELNADD
jgi:DNA-damage-inducible protein J